MGREIIAPTRRQEDTVISIEVARPITPSTSASKGAAKPEPSGDTDEDPLPAGSTTLGRIAANNGSQDSIPGAADWVAGYLSRNKSEGRPNHRGQPLEIAQLGSGFEVAQLLRVCYRQPLRQERDQG